MAAHASAAPPATCSLTSPAIKPPAASFFMPGEPMTEPPDGRIISDADAMAIA